MTDLEKRIIKSFLGCDDAPDVEHLAQFCEVAEQIVKEGLVAQKWDLLAEVCRLIKHDLKSPQVADDLWFHYKSENQ